MAYGETRRWHENIKVKVAGFFGQVLFLINSYTVVFRNVNHPDTQNNRYLFAVRHSQQCAVYTVLNRTNLYSMISRSTDGDLIAAAGGRVGVQCVRGSSKRGGAAAAKELIDKINEGASGILAVDGPKGPVNVPKRGIVEIAKLTGVPIVPMAWYGKTPTILQLPTWDKLRIPIIFGNTCTLFGEPIPVPSDASDEELEKIRQHLQDIMEELNTELVTNFQEYYKKGIRNTEHSKSVVPWF